MGFLVGLLTLVGCASYPQRFAYKNLPPNMRIIYGTSSKQVDEHCRKLLAGNRGGCHYDDGTPCAPNRPIRCCYKSRTNTMFVSPAVDGSKCVAHELCHHEGRPASECDRVHVK